MVRSVASDGKLYRFPPDKENAGNCATRNRTLVVQTLDSTIHQINHSSVDRDLHVSSG